MNASREQNLMNMASLNGSGVLRWDPTVCLWRQYPLSAVGAIIKSGVPSAWEDSGMMRDGQREEQHQWRIAYVDDGHDVDQSMGRSIFLPLFIYILFLSQNVSEMLQYSPIASPWKARTNSISACDVPPSISRSGYCMCISFSPYFHNITEALKSPLIT